MKKKGVKWFEDFSVIIYTSGSGNFGHTLMDSLYALFIGLTEHHIFTDEALLFVSFIKDLDRHWDWLFYIGKEIHDLDKLMKEKKREEMLCFRKVLVGSPFGYSRSDVNNYESRMRCGRSVTQKLFLLLNAF